MVLLRRTSFYEANESEELRVIVIKENKWLIKMRLKCMCESAKKVLNFSPWRDINLSPLHAFNGVKLASAFTQKKKFILRFSSPSLWKWGAIIKPEKFNCFIAIRESFFLFPFTRPIMRLFCVANLGSLQKFLRQFPLTIYMFLHASVVDACRAHKF